MDKYNDEPQFVHVPHLRAIDEKSLFACDATVDPEAQSVPQVAHLAESLRVQDVSEDLANLYHSQSGLIGIEHICCGSPIRLELFRNLVALERKANFQRRCKSLPASLRNK